MSIKDESPFIERTPDMVAKVRAMRAEAQKKMDRFTRVEDYDVRVVPARKIDKNRKPKPIELPPDKPDSSSEGEAS